MQRKKSGMKTYAKPNPIPSGRSEETVKEANEDDKIEEADAK